MNTTNDQLPEKNESDQFPELDELIKLIADMLPDELRAPFLLDMLYFKSIPKTDEVMRIIRTMQFLTILIDRVPGRVAEQYELFKRICADFIERAKELETSGKDVYMNLYNRLVALPTDIIKGLDPKTFVAHINDVLIKQFHLTTIPKTARQLAENAKAIETATAQHKKAFEELSSAWNSATKDAREAIRDLKTEVLRLMASLEDAKEKLEFRFDAIFSRTSMLIGFTILLMGFLLGVTPSIISRKRNEPITAEPTLIKTMQPHPPTAKKEQITKC